MSKNDRRSAPNLDKLAIGVAVGIAALASKPLEAGESKRGVMSSTAPDVSNLPKKLTAADLIVGATYTAADGGDDITITKRSSADYWHWESKSKWGMSPTEALLERIVARVPDSDGPDAHDGHDSEGFAGGCERLGHTVETCDSPKVEEKTAKRKRIRVRSKPLTEADIVIGGEYVPKRGNDKTPNYKVVDLGNNYVSWTRGPAEAGTAGAFEMANFLALVARRAS